MTQPLWAYSGYAEDAYKCPSLNMYSPADGTPIICTSNKPSLFYRNRAINQSDPGGDLANRIRTASMEYEPPFFITVYGGLKWTAGTPNPLEEFWCVETPLCPPPFFFNGINRGHGWGLSVRHHGGRDTKDPSVAPIVGVWYPSSVHLGQQQTTSASQLLC